MDAEVINEALASLKTAGDSRRKKNGDTANPTPAPKQRKTLKHYRDTLDLLFKHAVTWGWTASNPVEGVTPITKVQNHRVRYLDADERGRLLEACRTSTNPHLYTVVVLALATGARKGELLSLTLDDIDLTRGRAVLHQTKNGETRAVPVVGHALGLLQDHVPTMRAQYDAMPSQPKTRWLFPGREGAARSTSAPPGRTPASARALPTSASTTCGTARRATSPCRVPTRWRLRKSSATAPCRW